METAINYWPLLGVLVIVVGFALRLNPMLVVVTAGITSAVAAELSIPDLLALLGKSFISSRNMLLYVLTLPAIALLERAGLREHAKNWIAKLRGVTLARLLIAYMALRQVLSMLGLVDLGGHAQTVRPLLAPMAEAEAERLQPALSEDDRDRVKALSAATENVARFFGEDVFFAFSAVLLIQSFLAGHGIALEPKDISLWALPTAIAAFVIHSLRIVAFQRRLARQRVKDGDAH